MMGRIQGSKPETTTVKRLADTLIAVAVLFTAAGSAYAHDMFLSGNSLYSYCQSAAGSFCTGYIAGIADVLLDKQPVAGIKACIPNNVTPDQLRAVVTKSLTEHPESRHYSARSLTALAIATAFPCPK